MGAADSTHSAEPKISFGVFPKLRLGEDCGGAEVVVDGLAVATIYREVAWETTGISATSYAGVHGYRVEFHPFDDPSLDETFPTLKRARDHVRAVVATVSRARLAELRAQFYGLRRVAPGQKE